MAWLQTYFQANDLSQIFKCAYVKFPFPDTCATHQLPHWPVAAPDMSDSSLSRWTSLRVPGRAGDADQETRGWSCSDILLPGCPTRWLPVMEPRPLRDCTTGSEAHRGPERPAHLRSCVRTAGCRR